MRKYQKEDRELLLGRKSGKGIKGKTLDRRVTECYSKSHIKKAHFSPAERLDNYYLIETKDGRKFEVHIRTDPKPGKNPPPLSKIRRDLKQEYKGAKVYEYQDGKKVKI